MNQFYVITYWHDGDDETIDTIIVKTEAEFEAVLDILEQAQVTIIDARLQGYATVKQVKDSFKDLLNN